MWKTVVLVMNTEVFLNSFKVHSREIYWKPLPWRVPRWCPWRKELPRFLLEGRFHLSAQSPIVNVCVPASGHSHPCDSCAWRWVPFASCIGWWPAFLIQLKHLLKEMDDSVYLTCPTLPASLCCLFPGLYFYVLHCKLRKGITYLLTYSPQCLRNQYIACTQWIFWVLVNAGNIVKHIQLIRYSFLVFILILY